MYTVMTRVSRFWQIEYVPCLCKFSMTHLTTWCFEKASKSRLLLRITMGILSFRKPELVPSFGLSQMRQSTSSMTQTQPTLSSLDLFGQRDLRMVLLLYSTSISTGMAVLVMMFTHYLNPEFFPLTIQLVLC
jgi:hypothetical protein